MLTVLLILSQQKSHDNAGNYEVRRLWDLNLVKKHGREC
jgi:hypothetical protein